jgi:hypothetical protein
MTALIRRFRTFNRRDGERGQILILFAVGLVAFIGFAALTVDIGGLYVARRDYQNATDAAALAGASYLTRPLGDPCADTPGTTKPVCARTAAWNYLNDHLGLGLAASDVSTFAASDTPQSGQQVPTSGGPDAYTVWVSTPPNGAGAAASTSTVASEKSVIFVRVDHHRDTFFGHVFVPNGFMVSAWSTAGVFPNRFAVITLRRGRGGAEIDDGDSGAEDIKISGGSHLDVVNGDVGGNFGMRVDGAAGTSLRVYSTTGDEADVYLTDYLSCGNSCWNAAQVTNQGGTPVAVKKLPSFVPDPAYAAPPGLNSSAPNGQMLTGPLTIPKAQGTDAQGDLTINNNDTSGVTADKLTCNTGVKRSVIGPGWYHDIDVAGDQCVILSGNRQRMVFNDATTETNVPTTQQPGIIYITGDLRIGNNALIVGDGVTVVMRPNGSNSQFSPNGVLDLNTGKASGTAQKLGGWTTKAVRTYQIVAGKWEYQSLLEGDPNTNGVGLAFYVLAPTQYSTGSASDANTAVVKVLSTGAGMSWLGVTYAPRDNVVMSGAQGHDGFGQLVSWTFTFTGGTLVKQAYDGPGDGFPYLIEPCVLVSGACQ